MDLSVRSALHAAPVSPALRGAATATAAPSYFSPAEYARLRQLGDPRQGWDLGLTAEGTWGRGGAGILMLSDDGRQVLLLQRAAWVSEPGSWGIAGGARRETPKGLEAALVAAVAETKEELGHMPEQARLRRAPIVYQRPNTHFSYATYVLEMTPAEKARYRPRLNDETLDCRWFSVDALPHNVHPGVLAALEAALGRRLAAAPSPWS